jgi:RNA polymerase sigma factor (sigma-70 family)
MFSGPNNRKQSDLVVNSRTPHVTRELEREMLLVSKRSRQLSEELPSLSHLVVCTDPKEQGQLLSQILECQRSVATEISAISALQTKMPVKSFAKYAPLFRSACERQLVVADLRDRAEALFVSASSVPVAVSLLSKKQTEDLLNAFHVHRKAYWNLMYRVPAIQRHVLEELTAAMADTRAPSLVVHRDSSKKVDEACIRRRVQRVVTQVTRLIDLPSGRVPRRNRELAAALLLKTPIGPEKLNEQMLVLRQSAQRLADLETRLKCAHKSLRAGTSRKDPLLVEWRALAQDCGGGALDARKLVSELARAQEPYLRIRQYLTTANIPFVKKLINYSRKFAPHKDDIVQEGSLGFMHAIEKYDPKSGFALLTYAGFWVRQVALRGYERESSLVRVPSRLYVPLAKLRAEPEEARRRSDQMLGEKLGLEGHEVQYLKPFVNQPQSIDRTIPGVGASPASLIPTRQPPVEAAVMDGEHHAHIAEQVRAILKELPKREQSIIEARFGLDGKGERTLLQVGEELGVTRERVRQLQNIILNRLRRGSFGAKLRKIAEEMN